YVAVVQTGAEDDLSVHLDVVRQEPLQVLVDQRPLRRPEQPRANLRVPGVDADVQRAEVEADDPLELRLGQVRQRDEVAVQEGEAVVVVLDVETAAHLAPVLVDETEIAVIAADTDPVKYVRGKSDAKSLVRFLLNAHRVCFFPAASGSDDELDFLVGN